MINYNLNQRPHCAYKWIVKTAIKGITQRPIGPEDLFI